MSQLFRKTAVTMILGLGFAACATPGTTDEVKPVATVEKSAPAVTRQTASQTASPAEGCDYDLKMSIEQRRIIISNAVIGAEKLMLQPTRAASDDVVRARIGTFAAGSVDDSVPFISVDRECWASFYEAQNALIAGNLKESAEASSAWRVCLNANFPNRVAMAQPYFSCFELKK